MEVVLVESQPYNSYATVGQADLYLAASSHAANWAAAADLVKAQALVTATRILDRQKWAAAYDTQAEREGVVDIQEASMEMALALVDGSDLQSEQTTGQKLQSIKAGSVALTYFRGAEGTALPLPLAVWQLIAPYLAGGSTLTDAQSTGTEMCNPLERSLGVWMG